MRILNVKEAGVTRGVLSLNPELLTDHTEITFADHNGTPHTIFVHKNGPFTDPQAAVEAWENGTLHGDADEVEVVRDPLSPAGIVTGNDRPVA
jgi:hypothetical protein